ncbi:uncharacterized protein PSFLO_06936 [Pseudozyma flocculosa]|uniref:Uncharacterized protein n=1 Tax=Pseudozyma flocculosa TaxID=84751 RepID=A0A5C3FAI4_9BASI|nr:uncharacterized protein PSFLO_06936 [Pseudozyma flocculosa]
MEARPRRQAACSCPLHRRSFPPDHYHRPFACHRPSPAIGPSPAAATRLLSTPPTCINVANITLALCTDATTFVGRCHHHCRLAATATANADLPPPSMLIRRHHRRQLARTLHTTPVTSSTLRLHTRRQAIRTLSGESNTPHMPH